MIHVVDFEKTALFDPFSGHFCPHAAHNSTLRAEWASH